jgi:predicted nucleic acid-binding protein
MALIVADTDVLIDFLAGIEPMASRVARALQTGTMSTTAVTRFELLAGATRPIQRRAASELLSALRMLPLDTESADLAAEIRIDLDKRGLSIGMADTLIAGIAVANDGTLLTRNRRHFERVRGLSLADV